MYLTLFPQLQALIHACPTKNSVNIRKTAFCTRFLTKCKNLRKQGIWRLFCNIPRNVQNMPDLHNIEKMIENAVLSAILAKCLKCVQNGCFSFFLKKLQIITILQNNNTTMENYVFYAFFKVPTINPCEPYEKISKHTNNSVLHSFFIKMQKFAKTRHLTPVLQFSQKCAKYARLAQ